MSNATHPAVHPPPVANTEGGFLNGVVILSSPVSLLIVQILLILSLSRLLGFLIQRINQPRVIAEVIAGILLGPTACGHIPGFTATIFPASKLPMLSMVSNLGLIFFLFIVGLELDLSLLRTNAKKALVISAAGIIVPLGVGSGVGVFIHNALTDGSVPLGSVMLFIGVAYAITAFPVLARILSELKLLGTPVGIVTISAAAVGDAAAWCLLAVTIAIVSINNPLNSLYIFFMLIGFCLVMALLGRFVISRIPIADNPSQNLVMLALVLCLVSAWYTDFIGVHAIFGAFVTGVIMPRKQGFTVHLTEKIEDLVSIILLPLYFAYSGLGTNIGLLDTGLVWGAVFLVISTACITKMVSSFTAARILGIPLRESVTIGILMNSKGLVELIVLNIGLNTGVINATVFTIMVLMALITTFITTPLTKWVYPKKYHRNTVNEEGKESLGRISAHEIHLAEISNKIHVLVCVPPVSPMPLLMNIVQMLANYNKKANHIKLLIHTAHMIEVTDRYSSVLNATNPTDDAMTPIIEGFGSLHGVKITNQKIIASPEQFTEDIIQLISVANIDVVFYPWQLTADHEFHDSSPDIIEALVKVKPITVAVLVNAGVAGVINLSEAKLMVPFFGGADDRKAVELALSFGLLTCIIHYKSGKELEEDDEKLIQSISTIADKEPAVIYSAREYETEDDIVALIREEYENNHFSLIALGRVSTLKPSTDPSDFEVLLGTLPGNIIDDNFPVNLLVVKSGDNSGNFLNLLT